MPRKRPTLPKRAWGNEETPKLKVAAHTSEVPVSLDAAAVAQAIGERLPPQQICEPCKRSKNDEKLIVSLSIGVGILAITSVLCALISALIVATSSRTIEKLHNLLK